MNITSLLAEAASKNQMGSEIEYDIHGVVGIRVENASPQDSASIESYYGPFQRVLNRTPDIVLRFVNNIPLRNLRYVELERNGFTDSTFFILQVGKEATVITIDFTQIGEPCCEINCPQGTAVLPFLNTLVRLLTLKRGYVAVHASAFVFDGMGVLVTGWAKGGKTEALLAFAANGAQFIGDEWIVLTPDGQKMFGMPGEKIRLWDWHLDSAPELRRHAKRGDRLKFTSIHCLDRFQQTLSRGKLRSNFGARLLREAIPAARRQLSISRKPEEIFSTFFSNPGATPRKLFLLLNHSSPSFEVQPTDPLLLAKRMSSSFQYEMWPLMRHYLAFTFAFPQKKNSFVEHMPELYERILGRALADKQAYTVLHPYPYILGQLYHSMLPYLTEAGRELRPGSLKSA